ncbi:MAG: hypothetical protein NPIRA02_02830 [Nitrospirales bacterium]|nr:MAG: hypothetical protein NPIRA02_02830 [Nitrospirales bacterium]
MHNSILPSASIAQEKASTPHDDREAFKPHVHVLANKLLPITVFAQLALRHCKDPQVIKYLEKINMSAEEARVIVNQIQQFEEREVPVSTIETSP